jgi:hypothetical protein
MGSVFFVLGLFLGFSPHAYSNNASVTLVFTRMDCVKELVAHQKAPSGNLGFSVVKHGALQKSAVSRLEGLGYLMATGAKMGLNTILASYDRKELFDVPGGAVVKEAFQFSRGSNEKTLRINYELQLGQGRNSGEVRWNLDGVFTKGDWAQFEKGQEVEFRFAPEAWACVDRMVGPHHDSRNSTPGEQLFVLLNCLGTSVEANQSKTSTTAPARFLGTRYRLTFEGPASVVEMKLGSRGS